jgi:hypothetical protein
MYNRHIIEKLCLDLFNILVKTWTLSWSERSLSQLQQLLDKGQIGIIKILHKYQLNIKHIYLIAYKRTLSMKKDRNTA